MEVRTDKEGWVQGAQEVGEAPLEAPEDEIRHAAAEGARFFSETMRRVRKQGLDKDDAPWLLKMLSVTQGVMASLGRLKQAENGAMREARFIAHDFLPTPAERAAFIRAAQPSPIVRALPVPKGR